MTEEDWDLIYRVHLKGSFAVTKAAWPHMKQNNYGRIIMTASSSGLYGNFGQANYSAAKLGLVGLSNTLAIEGQKNGIHCNTIVPFAVSRLSQHVMPEDIWEMIKPEYVAPVVAYLCHDDCSETGAVFEAAGGWASKVRLQQADGVALREGDKAPSIETVRDNWNKITDFAKSSNHTSAAERIGHVIHKVKQVDKPSHNPEGAQKSKPAQSSVSSLSPFAGVDLVKLKEHQFDKRPFTYTKRDLMLYALGVGVKTGDPSSLKFIYENHPDFSALPTYGVITAWNGLGDVLTEALQDVPLDLTKLLHGEQHLEIMKPIPMSGTLYYQSKISDILDKRIGVSLVLEMTTTDAQNEVVCVNQFIGLIRGAGKFDGPQSSPHVKPLHMPPNRDPDAVVEDKTSVELAAIYRLSGDYNPAHIDPAISALGGFEHPILHGMSTFGHCARHVLSTFADNDVTKFKAMKARFSNPVWPGQTLRTEMWKEGNRISFRTLVVETGKVVVSGGYVDLTDSMSQKSVVGGETSSDVIFEQIRQRTAGNPGLVPTVNAIFRFRITKDCQVVKQWTIDLKNQPGSVAEGPSDVTPDCTLTISDSDFVDMATGKLNGQQVSDIFNV
jgi:3-hydroxyacyl-CoA dehydrogenase/3a,7a,12a-trihydroxy-5b-cholest-24-enoyl-CoA hydratase